MARQAVDGKWFDTNSAKQFEEDTYFDGHNFISKATGSQWDHETLWKTAKGSWVKQSWSQRQSDRETWEFIEEQEVAQWLIQNDHSDSVPANILAEMEA